MNRCLIYFRFLIIASSLYLMHFFLRKYVSAYSISIIRGYVGDFLALPVIVPIMTNVEILLGVRNRSRITLLEITFYTILFSLVFEWYSPMILNRGTSDFIDIIAYFLGGLMLLWTPPGIYPVKQVKVGCDQRTNVS